MDSNASSDVGGNPFGNERELFSTGTKKGRSPAPQPSPVFSFESVKRESTPAASVQPSQHTLDGWPSSLLEQTQGISQYISSVEGLQNSDLFQQHIRKKGNPFYLDAVRGKMETYKVLRRIDPIGFRKLWSRTDIREYDTVAAPTWLLLLEYVLSLCTSVSVLLWALTEHQQAYSRWVPVAAWVVLQVRAWSRGHMSAYGSLFGLYLVRDKVEGAEAQHQPVAGLLSSASAQLAEFIYLFVTFGVGMLTSLVMMSFFPQRSPVGQRLVGVHPVRETSHLVHHARFEPPSKSYPTARTPAARSKASSVTPR